MVESSNGAKAHKDDCKHHWRIASPSGETSTGVCKNCGASREFQNYAYHSAMSRTRKAPTNQAASSR
jgi:hypothetical protein